LAVTAREQPRRAEWVGEPSADDAARVREQLHHLLLRWELPDEVVDDADLVAAELLSNVVVHARTTFRLSVRLQRPLLHLAVDDGCVGVTRARPFDPSGRRGRGLHLVNAMSLRWGWKEHDEGKTIWAEFVA
jgi:anti-sigma regulatory factor (Ser/Thr protein kinase)